MQILYFVVRNCPFLKYDNVNIKYSIYLNGNQTAALIYADGTARNIFCEKNGQ